jgi:hypothetical protein
MPSRAAGESTDDAIKPSDVQPDTIRYIVFSDLSKEIIGYLGSMQWMNPEFFETHLNRSGYDRLTDKRYTLSLDTWKTHGFKKSFGTIKWLRPVRRRMIRPGQGEDRQQIIEDDITRLSGQWRYGTQQIETLALPMNIFREEVPLSSNPNEIYWRDMTDENDDEDSGPMDYPAAWEERLTINKVSQRSQNIGI